METAPVILNVGTALATCRGDPALARALVEQYRACLPEERTALARARAATPPDWETVRDRAHRLRSGSAYLGAEQIAVAARELEECILARGSMDARAALWRTLDQAFQEFLKTSEAEGVSRPTVVNRP
jgi:HPt (histidine-containing phosphotransfer) domain-containing protein